MAASLFGRALFLAAAIAAVEGGRRDARRRCKKSKVPKKPPSNTKGTKGKAVGKTGGTEKK